MRLGTRTRYAARALVLLALAAPDSLMSARDIAQSQGLSVKYLEHLLSALQAAGLVRAERGPQGGYALARPATEIDLRQVYEALEGAEGFVPCAEGGADCDRDEACVTREVWREMHAACMSVLQRASLAELAERARRHAADQALMFHV